MATKTSAMHPDFPKWYREVGLDEDADRLKQRWAGVDALASAATRDDVEALIQLAFRTDPKPEDAVLERLHKPFLKADKNFLNWDNRREQEILCGATLAALFPRQTQMARVAALATSTSSLGGAREPAVPIDLPSLSEQATLRAGEAGRKRSDLAKAMAVQAYKVSVPEEVEQIAANNWAGIRSAISNTADSAEAALTETTQSANRALAAASQYIAIQDEELQMLWWLIGERSWDLDQPFASVDPGAAPIVLGKELAGMTNAIPGPPGIKALLSRTKIKPRKKLTVPDAINACDEDWLQEVPGHQSSSPVSQPILFAIARKLETREDTAWVAGWAAVAGVDANRSVPALDLAVLFYQEQLLARHPVGGAQ